MSDLSGTETILGPAAGLTVSGNDTSRVFQVDPSVSASISGLTITGGHADQGGGLFNSGTATLTNCTISGNTASGKGGGFSSSGTGTLINCTISGNTASNGGGMFIGSDTTTLGNTIVAGNTTTLPTIGDVQGVVTSQGNNLIGNTDGSSGWVASDEQHQLLPLNPQLEALADNGGPTPLRRGVHEVAWRLAPMVVRASRQQVVLGPAWREAGGFVPCRPGWRERTGPRLPGRRGLAARRRDTGIGVGSHVRDEATNRSERGCRPTNVRRSPNSLVRRRGNIAEERRGEVERATGVCRATAADFVRGTATTIVHDVSHSAEHR